MSTSVTYKSNVTKFLRKYDFLKEKALDEMGGVGVKNIKKEAPFITGDLRDANDYEVKEDSVDFINTMEYAPFVELGTWKMAANPFMRRGLNNSRLTFVGILAKNLKV